MCHKFFYRIGSGNGSFLRKRVFLLYVKKCNESSPPSAFLIRLFWRILNNLAPSTTRKTTRASTWAIVERRSHQKCIPINKNEKLLKHHGPSCNSSSRLRTWEIFTKILTRKRIFLWHIHRHIQNTVLIWVADYKISRLFLSEITFPLAILVY